MECDNNAIEGNNMIASMDHDYCSLINNQEESATEMRYYNEKKDVIADKENIPPKQSFKENTAKNITRSKGILASVNLKTKQMTPHKKAMYKIHRRTVAQLCKVKRRLFEKSTEAKEMKQLYESNTFQFIEDKLNSVSKNFIDSQLRNVSRSAYGKRWTEEDKAFSLSIYKRSPRLYRYLSVFFELPSPRTLKYILSNIPFDTGLNKALMHNLKQKFDAMMDSDKCCSLIFDEMSLSNEFYYESSADKIVGYEDLGEHGRSNRPANHALVLMVRGIKKSWKQIIGYYFTTATIASETLKIIIRNSITQLQSIGLHVMATVCDQGSTQRKALSELCSEKINDPTPYTFTVNNQPVVIIYDVPHLLKCTRNSLLRCNIAFDAHKVAKFEYVERAYQIDRQKDLKNLYKLKDAHFNFKDSYMKMKVRVAAAQLSHTVSATINTFCAAGWLPQESAFTSEFITIVDNLFDSLNGYTLHPADGKEYRRVLEEGSPHFELWNSLLPKIANWRLVDKNTGKDVTNEYVYLKNWQITIRSVRYLWQRLKRMNITFLNLRNLNQDCLENAFCQIRQHGVYNTNPSCHQFVAALKTIVLNNLTAPINPNANCEADMAKNLDDMRTLLNYIPDRDDADESVNLKLEQFVFSNNMDKFDFAGTYVAGFLLKQLTLPDLDCENCQQLFATTHQINHLFTENKEYSTNKESLIYAHDTVVTLIENVHRFVFSFLHKRGHEKHVEALIVNSIFEKMTTVPGFCSEHNCDNFIVKKAVRLFIYQYVKDKKKKKIQSSGHLEKLKKFHAL